MIERGEQEACAAVRMPIGVATMEVRRGALLVKARERLRVLELATQRISHMCDRRLVPQRRESCEQENARDHERERAP